MSVTPAVDRAAHATATNVPCAAIVGAELARPGTASVTDTARTARRCIGFLIEIDACRRKIESNYEVRRAGQSARSSGYRNRRGFRRLTGAAHLACAIIILSVPVHVRMTSMTPVRLTRLAAVIFLVAFPATARAQRTWSWTGDGSVFAGYNYQERKFADFSAWESQNWLMGTGERLVGDGRFIVDTMISLEPFTIGKLVYASDLRISPGGSPQLFQTGESYQGVPLVNFQHPHDLVMSLGATYRYVRPRT